MVRIRSLVITIFVFFYEARFIIMRVEQQMTQIPGENQPPITVPLTADQEEKKSIASVESLTSKTIFDLNGDGDDGTNKSELTVEFELLHDQYLTNFERKESLPSNKSADIYSHSGLLRKSVIISSSASSSARMENLILNGSPSVVTNSLTYSSTQYDTDDDVIKVDNTREDAEEFEVVDLANDIPTLPPFTVDTTAKDLSLEFADQMITNGHIGQRYVSDEASLSSMVHQRRRIAMVAVVGSIFVAVVIIVIIGKSIKIFYSFFSA